ncbi:hypothetical protein PG984_016410 [Apiospora sp. TS-2023a]
MSSNTPMSQTLGGASQSSSGDDNVGYSLTLGWDRSRALEDGNRVGAKKRKEPSYVFVQALVFTSGDRLLGFLFSKDSNMTGDGTDAKLEVRFLFRAPHYEIVYEGPMDPASLPLATRIALADKKYSLYRIRALNGYKPLVAGYSSEQASIVAKSFVPMLEKQDSFLVAIAERQKGQLKRWCREAVLGPYWSQ